MDAAYVDDLRLGYSNLFRDLSSSSLFGDFTPSCETAWNLPVLSACRMTFMADKHNIAIDHWKDRRSSLTCRRDHGRRHPGRGGRGAPCASRRAGGDPPGRPQRDHRGREIAIRY
jgi:hypothetical protein